MTNNKIMNNQLLFQLSDKFLDSELQIREKYKIETLLGEIVSNRMIGIAYKNLDLSCLSSEIINAMDILVLNNKKQYMTFRKNLIYLSSILESSNFNYALLKGAFLSTMLYEHGDRLSKDIDILIDSKDISRIQSLLLSNGFIQGYFNKKKNKIVPATRKEIIEARMNFGETIPFVKIENNKPLIVDINFSLDFKPNYSNVYEFLNNTICVNIDANNFKTLNTIDFLIHLCCHLYKEATTYEWVADRRDLMLYKFSDINVFLHKYGNIEYFENLYNRIMLFNLEKECYYTFENSSIIYPNIKNIDGFTNFMVKLKPNNISFMKQIIYPREKKVFKHNMDFVDWFFCEDRIAQLEEIPYEEN